MGLSRNLRSVHWLEANPEVLEFCSGSLVPALSDSGYRIRPPTKGASSELSSHPGEPLASDGVLRRLCVLRNLLPSDIVLALPNPCQGYECGKPNDSSKIETSV